MTQHPRKLQIDPPFWRDIRKLRVIGQVLFLIIAIALFVILFGNTQAALQRTGLTISFDFLNRTSQFAISEGLTPNPHSNEDTYGHAFAIGLVNTLRVVGVGLVLTTALGLIMGLARLSTNWLIRQIAIVYIEIMQNTPLLIQLFFLYSGVLLLLPPVRQAITLPGPIYLSVRGFAMPELRSTDTTTLWILIVAAAMLIGWLIWRQRRRIRIETGKPTYGVEIGLGIVVLATVISWFALPRQPYTVGVPQIEGVRYIENKGTVISPKFMAIAPNIPLIDVKADYQIVSPEFAAIVAGLVLYTGAFVAEIVRAGIQSVPTGQWEAARAQGFSYGQLLRLIVLPQALRVMIPPLTNQYLNLIKNSSLGAAVGFSDLFGVSKTVLQSGQVVSVIAIVMLLYLTLDLITSFIMNVINGRFQLKAR
jgi:general L-amino acid transport system permease protein